MVVGQGAFRYEALPRWEQLPEGWDLREVAGVAVDAADRVFVFCRGSHPVLVFDRDGRLLDAWGEGEFARPHGIAIAADGAVWLTDDDGHVVRKHTPDGRLMLRLGDGRPSDTGVERRDYRTIRRAAGPFNLPTNVAVGAGGEVYVSDGYGNARVHEFAPDGRLVRSWGEPGGGPGQFRLPHGVGLDAAGVLYVADRENSRIQRFRPGGCAPGETPAVWLGEWTHVGRPCLAVCDGAGRVYVAELGFRAGMYPGNTAPVADPPSGRVSVLNPEGEVLARWGQDDPQQPVFFHAPHAIAVDSRGDVYVGEVRPGRAPASARLLHKFARL